MKSIDLTEYFIVIETKEGGLTLLSIAGRPILPEIYLGKIIRYIVSKIHLLIVDYNLKLLVWDVNIPTQIVETNLNCIGKDISWNKIAHIKIIKDGVPCVELISGASFVFESTLKVWLQVDGPEDTTTMKYGNSWNAMELDSVTIEYSQNTHDVVSKTDLENQLARLSQLGYTEEYNHLLLKYCKILCEERDVLKLHDIAAYLRTLGSSCLGNVILLLNQHNIKLLGIE